MTRLFALTRFELGLWLRSVTFWLAVLVMHAFAFGTFTFHRLLTSHWLGEKILGSGLLYGSLLILFASATAVARDRAEGTEELFDTLPATNGQQLFSRWLSGAWLWLLLGIEIFTLAALFIVWQDGAVLEVWPLVSLYTLHYIPAILFIHTLGMALSVFIRQPVFLYPLLTVLWGASPQIAAAFAFEQRWLWKSLTLFHVIGVGTPVRRISELVGIFPFEWYALWQRVFFGGLTLLLLAVAALIFRAKRERGDARRPRRRAWSLVGGLVATALIGIGSFQYVALHSVTHATDVEALGQLIDRGIVAEAYELHVQISDPGWYTASAEVSVRNTSDVAIPDFDLLLSPYCQAIGFSPLADDGSVVAVSLPAPLNPGDTTEINLSYRCPVHPGIQRFPRSGTNAHIVDNLIYPKLSHEPILTYFTLTVEAPGDFMLAAGVPKVAQEDIGDGRLRTRYEGEAVRLDVFGASLAHDVIHGIETYYYPAHAAAMRNYVGELADRIAFYTTWLGEPEYVPGVTPLPIVVEYVVVASSYRSESIKNGFLAVPEWNVPQFYRTGNLDDARFLVSHASSLWWGSSLFDIFGSSVTEVEAAANRYLSALYVAHRDGEGRYDEAVAITEADLAAHQAGFFSGNVNLEAANRLGLYSRGDRVGIAVFLTLHEVRSTLGDEALRTVLQALQRRHVELAASPASHYGRATPESTSFWYIDAEGDPTTEASLHFLFDLIAALPGGADVVERSLGYLPAAAADRLRRTEG